ncbi:thioredoxin family protein [Cardinium endosymbiont of Culicoides punctatus]|uniref:thioredoxin family protein n=1 Tax=Cardinium endosymbiont of Culicoides punctatus TaxID=2304601 RepID=UPI0010591B48|nr:thioredoxin domain-containing protein [Cardinium endosymbiont of Culicoides punctatus]TDG95279.1 Thioredoxin [Cardinium endosymbiont of Culicoides punctatus]
MNTDVLELTDADFQDVINQHELVLVDFWAPWCGPCMKLSPIIEQLAIAYKGKAVISKINVDNNSRSFYRYSIKTIPTVLIFHKAFQMERLVGGNLPITQFEEALNKYLV